MVSGAGVYEEDVLGGVVVHFAAGLYVVVEGDYAGVLGWEGFLDFP